MAHAPGTLTSPVSPVSPVQSGGFGLGSGEFQPRKASVHVHPYEIIVIFSVFNRVFYKGAHWLFEAHISLYISRYIVAIGLKLAQL